MNKFGGSLAKIAVPGLGTAVIREALVRAKVALGQVNKVIVDQMLTAGSGQNSARQAVIRTGLPNMVSDLTINKVCGLGLRAVMLAANATIAGDAEIVVTGGQEDMSVAPHVLPDSRDGLRMGDTKLIDSMTVDGLWNVYNQHHMDITAENVVKEYDIAREAQDEFAVVSQSKAEAAQKLGRFSDGIIPILVPQCKDDPIAFAQDEFVHHGATLKLIAGLEPTSDKAGTATAANVSGLNNGTTAVVVMSAAKAKELGLTPLATIRTYASADLNSKIMGMGPVPVSKRCLSRAGWSVGGLDLMEINEAFATQALVVHQQMGWDTSKININGDTIAIGHPIGTSGCRIPVTLLHEMQKRDAKKGLTPLCIGGDMGMVLAVERP